MNRLIELCGFFLVVGFLWFVWPPLVLLGLGVGLIATANARPAPPSTDKGGRP